MQKQRLILSVSVCITLVLIGVLVVISKPFLHNKVRAKFTNDVRSFSP